MMLRQVDLEIKYIVFCSFMISGMQGIILLI